MRGEIVTLDLETTGLDPTTDLIIEVGAVRSLDGKILETFGTLIDPGIPIPPRVTAITGISDDDIQGAPTIREVLDELRQFVGTSPVMGHNVDFDLGFLRRYHIAETNTAIDTYELAAVLFPTAPRYNLTSLTESLGLQDLTNAHRALDDAIATMNLYQHLWGKLLALPLATLKEIVQASQDLQWNAKAPFVEALNMRVKTSMIEQQNDPESAIGPFKKAEKGWKRLKPNEDRTELSPKTLGSLIEPGGLLSQKVQGYESRKPQVDMLRAITQAFNKGNHLLIEAPTGTGKSIAYAIPAIYWAFTNNERVVISTATIALQDQLVNKDLPTLQSVLDVPFEMSVVKGRSNYLCPRRLHTVRRRSPTSIEELRMLAKILVWLLESNTGDRGEITLRGPAEEKTWARLSAQDEGCTLNRCESQMEGACPFYKARQQAEAAHVLVVNHALLLSDVNIGNRVLPDYRYLIVDEGHHLEAATTDGLSSQLDRNGLRRRFADLGDMKKGLLADILNAIKDKIPERKNSQIKEYVRSVADAVKAMSHHVDQYFSTLILFLRSNDEFQGSEYFVNVRITEQSRDREDWGEVQRVWSNLSEFTSVISKAMDTIARALATLEEFEIADYEDILSSTQTAARHLQSIHQQLDQFTDNPLPNTIYWCEVNPSDEYVSINAAPLHVGPLIQQHLWEPKECVVLTSATLSTAGSFDYLRERLDAATSAVDELTVESPFDYKNSTLLYIPTDIPDPINARNDYQLMVERGIIELATALDGRLLGLFTSYTQLRQTAQAITARLALGGITVFDQTSGSSRQLLIDSFKSSDKAVLLGTRSFWEGIDLPGDDLQALVISRLPFNVPTDPIFAARSETFDNSFLEYALPEAILRFRQGFGRLIRRKTDRGVVAIFDSRITSKRYGKHFIESLPDCTIQRGPIAKLPLAAKDWMKRA